MLALLTAHLSDIVAALTSLVTAASLVANITPSEADNKVVAVIAKAVNFLALNFKR